MCSSVITNTNQHQKSKRKSKISLFSLSLSHVFPFSALIMDSGNSGSMQSSSCGDEIEDYDSRAESNNFSATFLNNPSPTPPTTTRISHFLNPPQQQNHNQMFDPLVNYYMDSLQKSSNPNQNSFLNLDMMWAKATARSEPNNNDLSSLLVPSSSSSSSHQNQQQQAFLLSQLAAGQTRENIGSIPTTHQHQQHHSLPQQESTSRGGISLTNDQQNLSNNNNMGRNPKKRSRASRRAPTTVLTTDTTNFRAMVQEFTGIPAPPFSSPFPRTRLDLFGSSVSSSRSLSSHMDPPPPPPPPYLLRPFAQKIQPHHHSFSQISSSFPSLENLASNNSTNNNPSTNSASINYHLSQQQQHNHPLMQHNQILGFQSSISATKYPHGPHQTSLEFSPKMGTTVFEELGLSHANVNNNTNNIGVLHQQQNMVPASSSDGVNNNNMPNTSEDQWGQRRGSSSINGDNDGGGILGSLSGIQERNSSASDFGVEKGQECAVVATRGEGTVESWINCSSSD